MAKFLNGFFPLAAYGQTGQSNLAVWKNLGANAAYGAGTTSNAQNVRDWATACNNLGLKQIRQIAGSTGGTPPTAGNYSALSTDPDRPVALGGTGNVIAWAGCMPNGTEWDEIEYSIGPATSTWAYVNNVVTAIRAIDAVTPITLNSGFCTYATTGNIQDGWTMDTAESAVSIEHLFENIDWWSNDCYPWGGAGYNQGWNNPSDPNRIPNGNLNEKSADGYGAADAPGRIVKNIRDHAHLTTVMPRGGQRTMMVCIEAGDVTGGAQYPSAGGLRAQLWGAIIAGVRGIILFAQDNAYLPGTNGTSTPTGTALEMQTQCNRIQALSSVIQDDVNPAGYSCSVPVPLRAGWRHDTTGTYFFVVNTCADTLTNAQVTVSGVSGSAAVLYESRNTTPAAGVITDNFGAYAVHIYQFTGGASAESTQSDALKMGDAFSSSPLGFYSGTESDRLKLGDSFAVRASSYLSSTSDRLRLGDSFLAAGGVQFPLQGQILERLKVGDAFASLRAPTDPGRLEERVQLVDAFDVGLWSNDIIGQLEWFLNQWMPGVSMGNFIADGTKALPGVKSDARSVPISADEWCATDANMLRQALIDVRSYLITTWPGGVTAPLVVGDPARNTALINLIIALESMGLILNGTPNKGLRDTAVFSDSFFAARG